jgi:hypothetical protein
MSGIDQELIRYISSVKDTLGRKLNYIKMNLDEAERKLDEAERAEAACHARQHRNKYGDLVPSCSCEENAAAAAWKEAEKWRGKYKRAKQIFDECQQEIADYLSGGHEFIRNMSGQQTHEASQTLRDCVDRIQDILSTNVM